jgi:hypothetical protein
MIKYRVNLGDGYIEFADATAAETYRIDNGIADPVESIDEAPTFDPDKLIDEAWKAADALAWSYANGNARSRYLLWLIDPATTPSIRAKIIAIQQSMDYIWKHYYTVVGTIRAGYPAYFDPSGIPPCPYTFGQIANEAMHG